MFQQLRWLIMRKVGAFIAAAACAAVVCSSPPAAAFGLRIGPFHIGVPLYFPHFRSHHHPLYMRADRHDTARTESGKGATSALLYPNLGFAGDIPECLFPRPTSPWPFNYERIFSTAFARLPASEDGRLCQPSVDTNAIMSRIGAEVAPNAGSGAIVAKTRRRARRGVRLSGKVLPERYSGPARRPAASSWSRRSRN